MIFKSTLNKSKMYFYFYLIKVVFSGGIAHNYGPLSHLKMSKYIWSTIVKPGDIIIDATCGNGNDALHLSKLALPSMEGLIYCIDIQPNAIEQTKTLFLENYDKDVVDKNVKLICGSHETFPNEIKPNSVSLICYNLGYLPGKQRNNKLQDLNDNEVTNALTTIKSITNALSLVKEGGLISIIAYPGHQGGKEELLEINHMLATLDMKVWRVYSHVPLNRPISPTLFNIFKIEKFGYKT